MLGFAPVAALPVGAISRTISAIVVVRPIRWVTLDAARSNRQTLSAARSNRASLSAARSNRLELPAEG